MRPSSVSVSKSGRFVDVIALVSQQFSRSFDVQGPWLVIGYSIDGDVKVVGSRGQIRGCCEACGVWPSDDVATSQVDAVVLSTHKGRRA